MFITMAQNYHVYKLAKYVIWCSHSPYFEEFIQQFTNKYINYVNRIQVTVILSNVLVYKIEIC